MALSANESFKLTYN